MSTETELQPAVRPSSIRRDSRRKGTYMIAPQVSLAGTSLLFAPVSGNHLKESFAFLESFLIVSSASSYFFSKFLSQEIKALSLICYAVLPLGKKNKKKYWFKKRVPQCVNTHLSAAFPFCVNCVLIGC